MTNKRQMKLEAGDILLAYIPYETLLQECEVEEIAPQSKCVKINGEWYEAKTVTQKIKATIGKAVYSKGFFGRVKRTVNYI